MDPLRPETFNHRTEVLSTSRRYHFVDQVPERYNPGTTPTLLCIHGFPDLWYGWRYQIGPWVRKGYRVIVPDMLGYGGTDKPSEVGEYSTKKLCEDLAGLLDLVGVERAVVIGHDWGSYVASRFALWYPDRLMALVLLSIPYTPPAPMYFPIEEVAKRLPNMGYQVYFADERSTKEVEDNLSTFLSVLFSQPKTGKDFTGLGQLRKLLLDKEDVSSFVGHLNEMEHKYYLDQLANMLGPLSYYRTSKIRYEEEKAGNLSTNLPLDLPVLFLWGTKDPASMPAHVERSRKFIPRLQDFALEGKGHWLMVEAKDVVTEQVLDWLDRLELLRFAAKL
ncbi:hypothetical protein JAAARDRAFT_52384 [Jaapia argillacea MUCL 33604]|uniref:AB hydrolase-1 domain-containing protein n=1 Tax=Jaapia argillacea MUCL 33604 TaxID=933084 RepID=A0A067QLR4_9AGAM|nr:hypothetical protein JAAARDRAFT_52384 [Jaapia argillacea MUCL 33604]